MHPLRRKRLMIIGFIVIFSSIGAWLIILALQENMNLFYSPSSVAKGEVPYDKPIRIGGYVVRDSVKRSDVGLEVNFSLTDGSAEVSVSYTGILPDLFSEGEAAVAKGKLVSGNHFLATEVLAKHDENYTPPEVMDTAVKPDDKKQEK